MAIDEIPTILKNKRIQTRIPIEVEGLKSKKMKAVITLEDTSGSETTTSYE